MDGGIDLAEWSLDEIQKTFVLDSATLSIALPALEVGLSAKFEAFNKKENVDVDIKFPPDVDSIVQAIWEYVQDKFKLG